MPFMHGKNVIGDTAEAMVYIKNHNLMKKVVMAHFDTFGLGELDYIDNISEGYMENVTKENLLYDALESLKEFEDGTSFAGIKWKD